MLKKYFSSLFIALMLAPLGIVAQNVDVSSIQAYLSTNSSLKQSDIAGLKIKDQHFSKSLNGQLVYVQQYHQNIPVFNAMGNFLVKNGRVNQAKDNFISDLSTKANTTQTAFGATQAVNKVAAALNLNPTGLELLSSEEGIYKFNNAGISATNIQANKVYYPSGESMRLAWEVSLQLKDGSHWWNIRLDANNGTILHRDDWIVSCNFDTEKHSTLAHRMHTNVANKFGFKALSSPQDGSVYNVYNMVAQSPNFGTRTLENNPANALGSPYGWHDTDQVVGPEYTITRGNNVFAYENRDGDNATGYAPDGGSNLNFDFPLNLEQDPDGYIDASVTNLFYWNNIVHDLWYNYGFDEPSGNFQQNNYGRGATFTANDPVYARGQDGANQGPGNNATFGTPPDGQSPVMRMFTWAPTGAPQVLTVNSPSNFAGSYTGTTANFGPSIPVNGITGDFVIAEDDNAGNSIDPYDACDNITNASAIDGNIAIIRRGECSFVDKVNAMQQAGAIAVIIVNNVSGPPINMGGNSGTITIPSIMLTLSDGLPMINAIEAGNTINGTIIESGPYQKDGSLDGTIIAHEYGHGVSNRLTGGSANASCLYSCEEVDEDGNCIQYTEQMGEGWSDYISLTMTMKSGDQATDPRSIATYAIGQDANGTGLRNAPYSTDFSINDFTYGDTNNGFQLSAPHGVGFVWATMLWDMTWGLIDEHGFDPDIYNGTGGNNIAMQLVIDGMKLQACNPGFIDGRDAILQADMEANNGENQCIIWTAFANRGLGYSADQGSSLDRADQTEAFDMPPADVLDCSMATQSYNDEQFMVYPNPANNLVNIKTKAVNGDTKIQIFDINGRSVMQRNLSVNETQIDVSQLTTGIYILKMTNDTASQTEKLIIE